MMVTPTPTVVLSSGGLRSLVAAALAVEEGSARQTALLHVRDGRACAAIRREHVRRQAEHFQITQVLESALPQVEGRPAAAESAGPPPLLQPQILLTALAAALELGAAKLVWPCQFNGSFESAAAATERVILLQQLTATDGANQLERVTIQTPLLELTDPELIELGGHANVPWELAWSCEVPGAAPCKMCGSCQRRKAAFDAAGISDPIGKLAAPTLR